MHVKKTSAGSATPASITKRPASQVASSSSSPAADLPLGTVSERVKRHVRQPNGGASQQTSLHTAAAGNPQLPAVSGFTKLSPDDKARLRAVLNNTLTADLPREIEHLVFKPHAARGDAPLQALFELNRSPEQSEKKDAIALQWYAARYVELQSQAQAGQVDKPVPSDKVRYRDALDDIVDAYLSVHGLDVPEFLRLVKG
jgi:hypothetical protein